VVNSKCTQPNVSLLRGGRYVPSWWQPNVRQASMLNPPMLNGSNVMGAEFGKTGSDVRRSRSAFGPVHGHAAYALQTPHGTYPFLPPDIKEAT
jgi:hypothetical protein